METNLSELVETRLNKPCVIVGPGPTMLDFPYKDFNGTINLGRKKISDFKLYKRYKKKLIPCDKKKIFNQLKLKIATDASLNLMKMKKIL